MKIYQHQTDALRAILLIWSRGYRHAVTFETSNNKLDALSQKFAENYGTQLPPWKRHIRKKKGLPNAWACAMPKAGSPGMSVIVLMASFQTLDKLAQSSPYRRERWRPADKVEIGDYRIAPQDKRDRGDYADTIKLTARTLSGIEQYWWALASQQQFEKLVDETWRAVKFYSLFGGVRRQLRRLIRGYKKLYEARLKKPWPGPNPEALPSIGKFRSEHEEAGKE
jgi:hypothetical protein